MQRVLQVGDLDHTTVLPPPIVPGGAMQPAITKAMGRCNAKVAAPFRQYRNRRRECLPCPGAGTILPGQRARVQPGKALTLRRLLVQTALRQQRVLV